ncbi:HKD family nuclease [Paenibacillus anaericanus]|uniref:phospholipase D family protein n=1 Tax=Paenibacillus anaericanus TaxID=170367 RepID=UPI002786BEEE|nr:phospholipase D family protein [Paenibacillus anaericanus]MDQ0090128.1 HKD family nuclease [Paenibacillus anaericanus]
MKILNNIDSRHFNEIKDLVMDADELHIISPYLMESFDVFFDEIIDPSEVKCIVLITTLRDNDSDLFKKANSLYSFSLNCLSRTIACRVHVDNKLHGKIYIASKGGSPIRGIITSANFTDRGLNHNHEWGVQINEPAPLKQIIVDISKVSSHALTHEELHNIIVKIDSFTQNGVPTAPKINLEINNFIKHKVVEPKSDVRFFIKPVGSSDEPFEPTSILSSDIELMHFSKRRPNSVRIGDILICYGVGTTKLLGYFEVISEPYTRDHVRWPWEVKAKNLCPKYSKSWMSFNNTISSIQTSFDTRLPVTYVGGKTLGALQFGSDKFRLSDEFAQHVINIIEGCVK